MVVVINEMAEQLDHFSFPQDRGGFDYFLQRVEGLRQKYQASEIAVAMEPSNYFWKLLARELEEKKITYHLVNSYTVKKHREGDQLDRSKDDRRDAGQIAELSRNGKYTKTHLQKGAYEDLRLYATLYDQSVQAIRREKHFLWGLVGQAFPELSRVFKNLGGITSQALLMTCASAGTIRQLTLEDFITQVQAAYSGKRLYVARLCRVHQLAASSIGVTEGLGAIQLAIQIHLTELQTFQKQLKRVTIAMATCLASLSETHYLLSLKSLQAVSVAIFLAEVGDPKRYQSAAQWVKLAGIQPAPNTSGKKQRSQTPMSHQGRLACAPCFTSPACAWPVDNHFAQFYSHLQRRKNNPLTKMQALGVLMNKLLHICGRSFTTRPFTIHPSTSPSEH